jgi:UDP-2-acetamido-2,6-beta-L-arabino-hexul-4-ose reductase
VLELYKLLKEFHNLYEANIYPDLSDPFTRNLFNTYRSATFPATWPRELEMRSDERGVLFEAVKGGGGGQTFLSTTKPGIIRGNHFHLHKVERFLVIQGEAIIRIRKVLSQVVYEFRVTGDTPTPVDMPTLHTHSIENVGAKELLTLFWTHEPFDPNNPDTYFDKVLQ